MDKLIRNITNVTGSIIFIITFVLGMLVIIRGVSKYRDANQILEHGVLDHQSNYGSYVSHLENECLLGKVLIVLGAIIVIASIFLYAYAGKRLHIQQASSSPYKSVLCSHCGLPVCTTVQTCPRCKNSISSSKESVYIASPPTSKDPTSQSSPGIKQPKFCVQCGKPLHSDDIFCTHCGKKTRND